MEIKNVLIEHRPRLRSINIFIVFTTPIRSLDSVKVILANEEIHLQIEDRQEFHLQFQPFLSLQPQTLSLLNANGNFLSFRVNTNPSQAVNKTISSNNNFQLNFNLKPGEFYQILCANCEVRLGEGRFSRILELPSDNLDMNDWFCCKHKHEAKVECTEDSTTKEKFNSSRFSPKSDEIFFGNFFALFDRSLFSNSASCPQCNHLLGEEITRCSTLKIWNENIKFSKPGETATTRLFDCPDLYENFLFIVQKYLKDFTFEGMGMPNVFKLAIETKDKNGISSFLLTQIMDRNLEILQLKCVEEAGVVTLKPSTTMKIMYTVVDANDETLKMWQNDMSVTEIQISSTMFTVVLDNLQTNATFIPECYRYNKNFTMSYLTLS